MGERWYYSNVRVVGRKFVEGDVVDPLPGEGIVELRLMTTTTCKAVRSEQIIHNFYTPLLFLDIPPLIHSHVRHKIIALGGFDDTTTGRLAFEITEEICRRRPSLEFLLILEMVAERTVACVHCTNDDDESLYVESTGSSPDFVDYASEDEDMNDGDDGCWDSESTASSPNFVHCGEEDDDDCSSDVQSTASDFESIAPVLHRL